MSFERLPQARRRLRHGVSPASWAQERGPDAALRALQGSAGNQAATSLLSGGGAAGPTVQRQVDLDPERMPQPVHIWSGGADPARWGAFCTRFARNDFGNLHEVATAFARFCKEPVDVAPGVVAGLLEQLEKIVEPTSPPGPDELVPADASGIHAMTGRILARYPPSAHVFVALGASADPFAVTLGHRGAEVHHLPLSGIPDADEIWQRHRGLGTDLVNFLLVHVRPWPPLGRAIVVLDAMSSGTALLTAKKLIAMTDRVEHPVESGRDRRALLRECMDDEFRPDMEPAANARRIILHSLNVPVSDVGRGRVVQGRIEVDIPQTPELWAVAWRIYYQMFKNQRLFPKADFASIRSNTLPQLNPDNLRRMKATLGVDS